MRDPMYGALLAAARRGAHGTLTPPGRGQITTRFRVVNSWIDPLPWLLAAIAGTVNLAGGEEKPGRFATFHTHLAKWGSTRKFLMSKD
jgi:hypothetical protein